MAAPITSYGYAGTIAPNEVWARMQYALGNRFFVLDAASASVSPVSGAGRQVTIAKGTFGGSGILDDLTQDYPFTFPTVAGEVWFMLVARRSWGIVQRTDFVAINAGSGASLPARSTRPGTEDDQPLALVQVRADGTVGTVRDLRAIGGHGNFVAYDALVRTYLLLPGASLRIGPDSFSCVLQSGAPTWVSDPSPSRKTDNLTAASGAAVVTPSSGWSSAGLQVSAARDGNVVEVAVELSRTGSTIKVDGTGGVDDTQIATIAATWAPSVRKTVACYYIGGTSSSSRGSFAGVVTISTNGNVYFTAGSSDADLVKRTDGVRSITFDYTAIQR